MNTLDLAAMLAKLGAGTLAIVLLLLAFRWGAAIGTKLVDRLITAFDGIVLELRALRSEMAAASAQHADVKAHVTEQMGDTRHSLRNELVKTGEDIKEHVETQADRVVLRLRSSQPDSDPPPLRPRRPA